MTRRQFKECPECGSFKEVMFSYTSGVFMVHNLVCGHKVSVDRTPKPKPKKGKPNQGGLL